MKIPLKEFFKNSSKNSFKLSPDNKKVAYLDTFGKRTNIHILNIKTEKVTIVTKQQKRNISSFWWKNDDKLLYLQDNNGDENNHVFLVDIKSGDTKDLTPGSNLKVAGFNPLNNKVYIDGKVEFKNKVLIMHNKRITSSFDTYLYDISDDSFQMIDQSSPGESVHLRDSDTLKSVYKTIQTHGGTKFIKGNEEIMFLDSKDDFGIISFTSKEKKELFVYSNISRDKKAIFKADLDLKIISDPIFESDVVDVSDLHVNYFTKTPEYVSYHGDKYSIEYLDKEVEAKHKKWITELKKRFPNEKESIVVTNGVIGTDDKIILFDTFSDRKLSDEYIYLVDEDKIIKLTEDNEFLNPENLVEMKPISYKARDGLTIHGYLTLPKDNTGPVKIIVNPHGGPWVRDTWGYSPEVQFFANNGYGVFQPNFRISTGYGKEHFTKGWHQWGLDCQHDVTDGTNWLIDQGYTEKGMIGIYGGSYGGYATLMGIINEPDLYSAAVDYVGVSDLFTFWDGMPDYWKTPGNIFEEAIGNPHDDPERYKKVSPTYRANEIKTPLFVVQGAKDPRVPQLQADLIVQELKKNSVNVEYMLKEDEGHGFKNQENSFELYERMINFFNNNIAGN